MMSLSISVQQDDPNDANHIALLKSD